MVRMNAAAGADESEEQLRTMTAYFQSPLEGTMPYPVLPYGIYTIPSVSMIGQTEEQLRASGRRYVAGRAPYAAQDRARMLGDAAGMLKLLCDADTRELLGVHMIGETVTELLSELVLAKKLEATEEEILQAIHPHPTYSEAIMEAAGVAVGRAIHI